MDAGSTPTPKDESENEMTSYEFLRALVLAMVVDLILVAANCIAFVIRSAYRLKWKVHCWKLRLGIWAIEQREKIK